jgi:hypothetical protein
LSGLWQGDEARTGTASQNHFELSHRCRKDE